MATKNRNINVITDADGNKIVLINDIMEIKKETSKSCQVCNPTR